MDLDIWLVNWATPCYFNGASPTGSPQWGLRWKHHLCDKDTVTCNNDDLFCQLGLQKSLVKFESIYKTYFEDTYTNITKMVTILWKSELCSVCLCPCCNVYCNIVSYNKVLIYKFGKKKIDLYIYSSLYPSSINFMISCMEVFISNISDRTIFQN